MILLQLTANTGPEECCLAVRKALAVLLHECEAAGVGAELLEQVPSETPGNLRSVLLALDGHNALALANRWRGSVLWICPSPYQTGNKRKNWYLGAELFEPDAPATEANLQESDIRFDTLRASGPGGQHVNKTDSAVRATHMPTGLSVKVQTQRSQHANKQLARALLLHKLHDMASDATRAARSQRWLQHHSVERGNAVRVFSGAAFVDTTHIGRSPTQSQKSKK
ncbi:MAG: peptide chain release factor H [Rhodoferax sp.]